MRSKKVLTPLQGILFDFDGLIVDTETAIFHAWQEVYQEYNQEMDLSLWAAYVGKSVQETNPVEDLLNTLDRGVDPDELRGLIAELENKYVYKTDVLPGVKEIIEQAKERGIKMGIVSSSGETWVKKHLERLYLAQYFNSISTSDEVERAKPDPSLYYLGVSKLGVESERVIVLEDSPNGVLAAKRAGLYCIAVPNSVTLQMEYYQNGGKPDRILESLLDFSLDEYLG